MYARISLCMFEITAIPIQLCLKSKSRSFQYQNCVKVPEELKRKCQLEEYTEVEKLKDELRAYENITKVQTETASRLAQQLGINKFPSLEKKAWKNH